jgi:DNA/RNA endonuclease YhcR with UshA esterase domain
MRESVEFCERSAADRGITRSSKRQIQNLEGKAVTIMGEVIDYKGKPEIVITDEQQLKMNE